MASKASKVDRELSELSPMAIRLPWPKEGRKNGALPALTFPEKVSVDLCLSDTCPKINRCPSRIMQVLFKLFVSAGSQTK